MMSKKYFKKYESYINKGVVSDEDIEFLRNDRDLSACLKIYDRDSKNNNTLRSDFSGVELYGLTDNEGKIIFSYTHSGHIDLNKQLRAKKLNPIFTKYNELLSKCLNKLDDHEGVVYRGTDIDYLDDYLNIDKITIPNYLSCSRDREVADDFGGYYTMIINCSRGKNISKIAVYSDEKEILLLPSEYIINKIEDNLIYLTQI